MYDNNITIPRRSPRSEKSQLHFCKLAVSEFFVDGHTCEVVSHAHQQRIIGNSSAILRQCILAYHMQSTGTQKQSHVETISQIFLCILWLRYYKKSKPVHLLQFLCNSIIVYLCVICYYTFWASFSAIQLVTLSRSVLNNKVVTIIILSQQLKLVWSRNSSNHWFGGERFLKLITTCP